MKHIKLFKDLSNAVGQIVVTPNITMLNTVSNKILYIPLSDDKFIYIKNEDFITYLKDSIFITFDFDGINNKIGSHNLYNSLKELYLDGEIYDLDDLVISAGNGSGSGSGSGSAMNDISFPSTITGVHEVEYVLELDSEDSIDISGTGWFNDCIGITKITLPIFISKIDKNTFVNCKNLTDANINSLRVINYKDYLTYTTYDGLTVKILPYVKNIVIGDSVTAISDFAFYNCTSLKSIEISDSVMSMGFRVFDGCTALPVENHIRYADTCAVGVDNMTLTTYALKEGTRFLITTFEKCTKLTSIEIPSSVTSIGGSAFNSCVSLTSIEIPSSVTSIGIATFLNCTSLGSIVIPDSVTSIGGSAFYGCTRLTSIEIGSSVTSIGDAAFKSCTGLTSIEIPSSVTSIGSLVFLGCSGLTSITVDKNNKVYNDGNGSNCIIETSTNTLILGCKNTVIPSSVTSIGDNAFYGCTGLTSIEIPSSVTSIGDNAFYGCTSLTSIDIPSLVTEIGYSVFLGCTGLRSIVIPNLVTSIGNTTFLGCTNLTSIVIGSSVTSIGYSAFYGCTSLTSVVIGSSVKSIDGLAFYGCTGLTSIAIPDSVTEIGYSAFYNVAKVIYNGTATGSPWGAKSVVKS